MVAYSFKARFAEPILAGTKRQTIRAIGKRRHARPGDALQLYTGMRTKHCRKIADEVCTESVPITIEWRDVAFIAIDGNIIPASFRALSEFAMRDGFRSIDDMREFWRVNHPGVEVFDGVLIRW